MGDQRLGQMLDPRAEHRLPTERGRFQVDHAAPADGGRLWKVAEVKKEKVLEFEREFFKAIFQCSYFVLNPLLCFPWWIESQVSYLEYYLQ